jgi:hypothetical protein
MRAVARAWPFADYLPAWEDPSVNDAFPLHVGAGEATALRITSPEELERAARLLQLPTGRPVLVVVGGATGMSAADADLLRTAVEDVLAPLAGRLSATVVDGATDAGVMRVLGRARARAAQPYQLVGVVVDALAATEDVRGGDTRLEPNHTHFLLVPGESWGDESEWIARVAAVLAGGARAATVLANGGEIAWNDVRCSVRDGRPVIALAGTGRTADVLAAAVRGGAAGEPASTLAASGLVHAVDVSDHDELARLVHDLLGGS